mmetsp:Transcript_5559/g.7909  ORF Transcript_5559/g.7909 Transcript_5559/m.7909 type:complete len:382 (-) Transcript_5559:218-1363(-)
MEDNNTSIETQPTVIETSNTNDPNSPHSTVATLIARKTTDHPTLRRMETKFKHELEPIQQLPREVRNLLAGGVAGMVAKSVVAPIDRIKILYQTSAMQFRLTQVPTTAMHIIRNEGMGALWKGNTATMIRVFPYSGIQFMVFDRCKRYFLHTNHEHQGSDDNASISSKHLSPLESLLAGSFAGAVSVTLTYPLDLTRAQLAVYKKKKHHQDPGFVRVLVKNFEKGGVRGLFRGITPTIMGILPYSGVAFAINEQAKKKITQLKHRSPTNWEKMKCGALSGLCAQTLTYPLEVTRRRMQTIGIVPNREAALQAFGEKSAHHVDVPLNMRTTIIHLWQEQGIRGFFKGVSMNWMKGPVAFSISFTTFDIVQGWFSKSQDDVQP